MTTTTKHSKALKIPRFKTKARWNKPTLANLCQRTGQNISPCGESSTVMAPAHRKTPSPRQVGSHPTSTSVEGPWRKSVWESSLRAWWRWPFKDPGPKLFRVLKVKNSTLDWDLRSTEMQKHNLFPTAGFC